jgi:hypothetical protein
MIDRLLQDETPARAPDEARATPHQAALPPDAGRSDEDAGAPVIGVPEARIAKARYATPERSPATTGSPPNPRS